MAHENKTHVIMKSDSKDKNMDVWKEGERGYIDGYTGGGSIAVVIGSRIIICDTWDVKVYTPMSPDLGPK